jgi:hypothetical protein
MTHLEIDVRHSTSDIRHPAARIRDSPPSILHPAFCIAALAAVAASAASLPAGYTQYSYIESTGTQYIDTGIVPTTATRVISDFRLTEIPSAPIRNGWASAGSKEAFWFGIDNDHVCFSAAVSGNSLRADTGVPVDTSRHTFDISIGGIFFDGYGIANPGSPFTNAGSGKTMYLFASRQGWTPNIEKFAKMELYSCQVYSGDTLVRDFVPCTDENGKPGLFDAVYRQMYYNMASGDDFLFGFEEAPCDLSCTQSNGVWYATVSLWESSGEVNLNVVSPQGVTNVVSMSNGVATAPATFTIAIPGLAADTTYTIFASLTTGAITLPTESITISTHIAAVPEAGEAPPSAFTHHIEFAVADGKIPAGTTISGLPVLVRLSTAIAGFDYGDFALPGGGDLLFTDTAGNILPYEIDTWDTNGTSFVWVRLPEAAAGTRLLCHYGRAIDHGATATGVWRDYIGVWHMNEASGAVADATGHGLAATPMGNTENSVAVFGAPTGIGRQTATSAAKGYLSVPNYDSFALDDTFTISGWVKRTGGGGYPRLFSRKTTYTGNGWEMEMRNSMTAFSARGNGSTYNCQGTFPTSLQNTWSHIVLAYSNTTVTVYQNGASVQTGTIAAATENGQPLSIGCNANGSETNVQGAFDECRLIDGASPPERVAAEYAAMADAAFLGSGSVNVTTPAPYCPAPTVTSDGNGGFTATVSLLYDSGTVELLVISPQGATNIVALSNGAATAPATFTAPLTGLAANTAYALAVRTTGDHATSVTTGGGVFTGEVTVQKTADATPASAGIFTVSRPAADGATNAPLTVAFTLSGTAVAGTHYEAIPASVTIPAGESSATVKVVTLTEVTGTTSLTLTLSGNSSLVGDPGTATMSVTSVRDPVALVWAAGTSATELTDPAHWTPSVPAVEENDTLSFTGDSESAYRFTMTNDLAVKSFAFANGTSPAVIDFGGHALSNDTVNTAGSFTQTGTGALTLLNGELDARTFSFQTATFAATNFLLHGNQAFGATTLSFARDGARYLFDKVQFDLTSTWYDKLSFNGWNYEIDARDWNVETPVVTEGNIGNLKFHGTNVNVRLYGTNTVLRGSLSLNGRNIRVSVTEGRFYRTGGNSYGTLSMVGDDNELTITNTLRSTCASAFLGFGSARQCTLRVAKGGKYNIWVYDGLTVDARHSFEGTSNLVEVADGTFTINALRIGFVAGAGGDGGNILAVRGDDSTVTFTDGCYVGNTNKLPTRLVFQPGETGFGGAAPIRQTWADKYVRIAANTVFEVNARNFTNTRDHGLFTLPLMSFRSNTEAEAAFSAEALATFNRNLVSRPRGGRLTLEANGNYRILTWTCRKDGTVLVLR